MSDPSEDSIFIINQLERRLKRAEANALAWKLVAKMNDKWNKLPEDEKAKAVEQALDSTMGDYCNLQDQIEEAAQIAFRYGMSDGAHHKQWVIDQMLRKMLGPFYEDRVKQENSLEQDAWDTGTAP